MDGVLRKEVGVDESEMVVTIPGSLAKIIRKVAILMEMNEGLALHAMLGMGLGMCAQSLRKPELLEEMKDAIKSGGLPGLPTN